MTARARLECETEDQDRSDYFYDMLDQLLVIGRQAGGDAMTDAVLIGGLLATRKKAKAGVD